MTNMKMAQNLIDYMVHWNLEQLKRSEEMLKRQMKKQNNKDKKRGEEDEKKA